MYLLTVLCSTVHANTKMQL